ncbi:hypothetical protein O7635_32895 [Asanoa sp. WMMD1127]|uniref:hypothetical protein n=1 Tax=Asanoa sp. WMMD1127 TaxID=3016107 RepID=UPI002415FF8E|nr:hypothetical protein [Asanoa sp. WMMD1127]MDG4826672.1 hypothetical protein [Asanoa sp. WMMD1127]
MALIDLDRPEPAGRATAARGPAWKVAAVAAVALLAVLPGETPAPPYSAPNCTLLVSPGDGAAVNHALIDPATGQITEAFRVAPGSVTRVSVVCDD